MQVENIEAYTKQKQLEALYNNVPTIVIFIALATTVVALTLAFTFPIVPVILWAAYMLIACFARWVSFRQFKKHGLEKFGETFWVTLFLFFSILTGAGTGHLVLYYFDPNNFVYAVFVFGTYAGFLSAGILSNSMFMPAFFAYSLPPTLMVLAKLFIVDEHALGTLAIMVGFYYVALIGFARNANRIFKENVTWNLERDSLVQELREQKETAEQAIRAKSNFFASASHDLRQPLHALGLFHDALRYRIQEPENLAIMDKISSSTQALNELLHGMLDISKLDASVVENKPKDINLQESLRLVYSEFSARANEKDLQLTFDLAPEINVWVDPVLFERVVRNLVDNAIKYTDKGFVGMSAKIAEDLVHLKISDTGIGIPSNQQENVFSEFNQLGNPERDKQKGLGLGLSIVRRLCRLMHVGIELSSQENQGTTVLLTLPLGKSTDEIEQEMSDSMTVGDSKILVIEDDFAILEGMSLLLETFGFQVLKAIDSEQALEISKVSRPDLIIADYRLPGSIDGLELIDAIRDQHEICMPAVLVTGDTAPDRMRKTESADVVVLHKPVEPEVLESTITEALKTYPYDTDLN